ncbi:ATP-binding protein [Paenibacillus sp. CF384]|uniref:ATP-binding protein n=1 Tax=Paenibacillus sp. CF384 TaxID=1884382 RepID=UPI00089B47B8|nr:ATP-binding protein [Paenibacillus sp. CF384]SDW67705.1 PAS domain S-box-containing protein [Paenibacillus sp. CF384]
MSELMIGDNWMLLMLALTINLFASITMYSMIGHLQMLRVMRQYWLLSGALVYGLGLWVSHFIILLTSDTMILIDWTIIVKLFSIMASAYGSFRLLGSRLSHMVRLLGSSLLMALGTSSLIYSTLLSLQVEGYSLHLNLACLSFVFSFFGTACSFYIFERKNGSMLIAGLLLGFVGIIMQLLGLETVTVIYSVVLTADRLNDYMQLLSVVLGLATLVIFVFSLVARYVDRRYTSMNERYKLLVETSIDMIAIIHDEKWEYINRSGLQMFAADSEADMLGKPVYQFLQPKFHTVLKRMLQVTKQRVRQSPIELDWYTVQGKPLHTEVIETSTKLSGKSVFQIIIRDISERKKNEELLINSEKLYVAGQLAAGIAHEIRNPLTSLKGFLQLIASGRNNSKNYYDIMKSELNRIESIVSELLMLSKPQIYELAYKDIRSIMADTITLLEAQAILHNIEIESNLGQEALWVRGVENQLKQVFINVLKNAIEVMMDGGQIKVTCLREGNRIIARIADRGPGIPQDQLAKIGQPFYTTKEKGTGLGLMVTYKIVDNHQGSIEVKSSMGDGTTFDIILPFQIPAEVTDVEVWNKVTPIHRLRQEDESAS